MNWQKNDNSRQHWQQAPPQNNQPRYGQGQQGGMMRGGQGMQGRVGQRGMYGGRNRKDAPMPGVVATPLQRSDNRWAPGKKASTDLDVVRGKVRSILNKLTKEKFDTLSLQLIELVISTCDDGATILKEIVTIVFDKALSEKHFASLYSELCESMDENLPSFKVFSKGNDGEEVVSETTFKRILLNKCQDEFMRGVQEISKEDTTEEKHEFKMLAQKRRMLGNIRFIGELYKLNMIVEKIMHECVQHLLQNGVDPEEENLESACDLLTTIGKKLDHKKAKVHMDVYFKRLESLSKHPGLPSRIRFMCLDVIDLRKMAWKPRLTEDAMKKLSKTNSQKTKPPVRAPVGLGLRPGAPGSFGRPGAPGGPGSFGSREKKVFNRFGPPPPSPQGTPQPKEEFPALPGTKKEEKPAATPKSSDRTPRSGDGPSSREDRERRSERRERSDSGRERDRDNSSRDRERRGERRERTDSGRERDRDRDRRSDRDRSRRSADRDRRSRRDRSRERESRGKDRSRSRERDRGRRSRDKDKDQERRGDQHDVPPHPHIHSTRGFAHNALCHTT